MATIYYEDIYDSLIRWAKLCLKKDIQDIEEIVSTPYSYVLKLKTKDKCYYLKHTSESLFIESRILKKLRTECCVTTVPEILAVNEELTCFRTYPTKFIYGIHKA